MDVMQGTAGGVHWNLQNSGLSQPLLAALGLTFSSIRSSPAQAAPTRGDKKANATGFTDGVRYQQIFIAPAFKSGGGGHFTLLQELGPAKVGPIATVATMAPVAIRIPTVRRTAKNRLVDIVPSRGAFHMAEERYKPPRRRRSLNVIGATTAAGAR
jgi:hypothetical protein